MSQNTLWKLPKNLCTNGSSTGMTSEKIENMLDVVKKMIYSLCEMMFPGIGGIFLRMLLEEDTKEKKFQENVMHLSKENRKSTVERRTLRSVLTTSVSCK